MRLRLVILGVAMFGAAGCQPGLPGQGDPLDDVPRLSDVNLPDAPESVALTAPADAGPGFLARLLGRGPDTSGVDAALAEALTDPNDAATIPDTDGEIPDAPLPDDAGVDASIEASETRSRTGLFGFLRRGAEAIATPAAATNDAALPAGHVAPMTMQAFGEMGVTCGLPANDLGTEIAKVSGFRVYDTFPNSTAPRPHYITGFNDRCARQFTAALVLTGDIGTHEVVRYQGSGRDLPYTSTDTAYEQIKRQICGVQHGQPCGARLDSFARHTTFITAYESFATSPIWADILLHHGELIGISVEER